MTTKPFYVLIAVSALVAGPCLAGSPKSDEVGTFRNIFSFFSGSDGYNPQAALSPDENGVLYGTARFGGDVACNNTGCGVVFKLSRNSQKSAVWKMTVLYRFAGGKDGGNPISPITIVNGRLYGTTLGTAANTPQCSDPAVSTAGCGTVFEISPPRQGQTEWTENVIHSFTGGSDGGTPWNGVVVSSDGNRLYGTTDRGGKYGFGTVFSLSRPSVGEPWRFWTIYNFAGDKDGEQPVARLTLTRSGSIFGSTLTGGDIESLPGAPGCGTIFELDPPKPGKTEWEKSTIHTFTGVDGCEPWGRLQETRVGELIGTSTIGGPGWAECKGGNVVDSKCGGNVFLLNRSRYETSGWTVKVIYQFKGEPDGALPFSDILQDRNGTLFGTTAGGGSAVAPLSVDKVLGGTVFELNPPSYGATTWTESVLHRFTGADGYHPNSVTMGSYDSIYGTTQYGGMDVSLYCCGTAYSLKLHRFDDLIEDSLAR